MLDVYADYFNAIADGSETKTIMTASQSELALKLIEKMPKLQEFAMMEDVKRPIANAVGSEEIAETEAKPIAIPTIGNPIEDAIRKVKSNALNGSTTK